MGDARTPRASIPSVRLHPVSRCVAPLSKGPGPFQEEREYPLHRGVHINVQEGERVAAGDPLMDGPRNPHDILDARGEKALQKYLVDEISRCHSRRSMRWPGM